MIEFPHPERESAVRKTNPDTISRGSGTVLRTAASVTPRLVQEHPEIVDLYRDTTLTQDDIARVVAPDIASPFPNAARATVGNVLSELISKKERAAITSERRRRTASRNLRGNLTEEEFRVKQSAASRARKTENIDYVAIVRKKGLTPWSDHEKSYALYLRTQSEYQYQGGTYNGLPIRSKIVEALNAIFHGGNTVRDINSLRGFFNQPKKK